MLHKVRHVVQSLWFTFLIHSSTAASTSTDQQVRRLDAVSSSSKGSRNLFSPRMDYDEWTPLGRGDPLKNDPTYDYVPPVLERVHYWIEPSSRTPDPPVPTKETPQKLQSSSADSRRDTYDPFFLKFVDGHKHRSHHHYQNYYQRRPPASNQRIYQYMPSHQHKKQRPYESHLIHSEKSFSESSNSSALGSDEGQHVRAPYTILVPPPLQIPSTFTMTSDTDPPATHSSITLQESNLVYEHSSSSSSTPEWQEGKTQLATTAVPSSHVTWKAPVPTSPFNIGPISVTEMHHVPYSPDVEVLPSTELNFTDSNAISFTPSTVAMTTAPSLTTDPLFSHYKQPVEPLRGPMYLIIQGHSKVKTYSANKQYHGIPLQDGNDIRTGKQLYLLNLHDKTEAANSHTHVTTVSSRRKRHLGLIEKFISNMLKD